MTTVGVRHPPATPIDRERHARRWVQSATLAHYAFLLLGAALLVYIGRNQDFFFDDWAFVLPDAGQNINAPHVGHWSATPTVAFLALRNIFGLENYLPFLALALVAHLTLAHLIWLVMVRVGANGWIASFLSGLFVLLGAGSENILWAFQFGFVGALAVGIGALLVVQEGRLTVVRAAVCALLLTWAVTFSGTALPVVGVVALVLWARHGIRNTLLVLATPVSVYLVWFLVEGRTRPGSTVTVDKGIPRTIIDTLQYAGSMFVDGLQKVVPIPFFGAVFTVVVLVWFVASGVRRHTRSFAAYALVVGAAVFALLTGYSRSDGGIEFASSSRYVYLIVALLLPAFALAASWAVAHDRTRLVAALSVISLLAVYNASTLVVDAGAQAAQEQLSRDRMNAALSIAGSTQGGTYDAELSPVLRWAPDVSTNDLLYFESAGWLRGGMFDEQDLLDVGAAFWVEFRPEPDPGSCLDTTNSPSEHLEVGSTPLTFYVPHPIGPDLALSSGGINGESRAVYLDEGWWSMSNSSEYVATLTPDPDTVFPCLPQPEVE
jgi:hypothetical protein